MKYFVTAISIAFLTTLVWGIFFSGLVLKKNTVAKPDGKTTNNSNINSTPMSDTIVLFETNFGPIKIKTDATSAPKTSENFVKLVNDGFYNNLTFHRIIPGFVIQGGDPDGNGQGGPGYTVPAEIKLAHKRGSVAMARLSDQMNPERASSGSQFYIALQDLPGLDGAYTVFGEVVSGMEIVDMIANVKTDDDDKPVQPVIIKKASIASE